MGLPKQGEGIITFSSKSDVTVEITSVLSKKIEDNLTDPYYYDKKEDGSYKYKIVYEFTIKGNKIIWVDGTAYGMLDYPNPY